MPAIRPPVLAVSGAVVSGLCVLAMAAAAVVASPPGPEPSSGVVETLLVAPTRPVPTTPLVVLSNR